nr:M15 family metallopeptidase [uncultured Oscillibacter sp.]
MRRSVRALCGLLALLFLLSGCSTKGLRGEETAPPPVRQETEPAEPLEKTDGGTEMEPALSEPAIQAPEDPAGEEPPDTEFVRVADYIPEIAVDLRYATADNFTGQVIYDFSDAYLRYGTVKKLAAAQTALAEQGYGLKIWDAFRPPTAQFVMWEICPDSTYVANPNKGFSSHSRGNTVDLTLIDAAGVEVTMPTGFDDFSPKADRDYSDVDPEAAENALLLEKVMTDAGFKPYTGEWWHFSDTDSYDVEDAFLPEGG